MVVHKHVVIFEVAGGGDKGPDGHRKDTIPTINAIKAKGFNAEVVYYEDAKVDQLFKQFDGKIDALISRINPGNIPGGEENYFKFLRKLSDTGILIMPHPDVMINFGAKDALCKLNDTGLVPPDTLAYYEYDDFVKKFPVTLSIAERVLKQNRGSTGEGIWRVVVEDTRKFEKNKALPLDTKIKCTEAVDNHVEHHELGKFMEFCKQYLIGYGGQLVDMRFLPRIKEGEIRILYVGEKPIFVVHKKPAEGADAFSATLFSGAKYTYTAPSEWPFLIDLFKAHSKQIYERLNIERAPLIWTADFILDDGPDGKDAFVLGELNCSCVGFTSELDKGIQDAIADEVIRVVNEVRGK